MENNNHLFTQPYYFTTDTDGYEIKIDVRKVVMIASSTEYAGCQVTFSEGATSKWLNAEGDDILTHKSHYEVLNNA